MFGTIIHGFGNLLAAAYELCLQWSRKYSQAVMSRIPIPCKIEQIIRYTLIFLPQ